MNYTIEEHKHRFAAWAAGRAASVNGCRFTVEQGKQIIESVSLNVIARAIDNLPDPDDFDNHHRIWRNDAIVAAQTHIGKNGDNLDFTHGVAAKLINIYLKSIFVCGNDYDHPKVKAIHPPIDSVLLDSLYNQNVNGLRSQWQIARKARWSKLSDRQYENIIFTIKQAVPINTGLWKIEEYWQGYQ